MCVFLPILLAVSLSSAMQAVLIVLMFLPHMVYPLLFMLGRFGHVFEAERCVSMAATFYGAIQ